MIYYLINDNESATKVSVEQKFVEKKKKIMRKKINMTPDTWHPTPDMWHLTPDTWHITHDGGWTYSQNFSSLALMFWVSWCFEGLEEKYYWMNQLMSDKGGCRKAPATLGMLKMYLTDI